MIFFDLLLIRKKIKENEHTTEKEILKVIGKK
jgi:hypothetical protein